MIPISPFKIHFVAMVFVMDLNFALLVLLIVVLVVHFAVMELATLMKVVPVVLWTVVLVNHNVELLGKSVMKMQTCIAVLALFVSLM